MQLLSSPHEDVREQASWALGNIAGDCQMNRDAVISAGAIPALIRLGETFTESTKVVVVRNVTWALSSMCRGKPKPPIEILRPILPLLFRLIHFTDLEVITDACWALSYISDGPDDHIQEVLSCGVMLRVIELLQSGNDSIITPALRIVGNVSTGNDQQTQMILDLNALPALKQLMNHHKKNIRKETCWTISNVTAGTSAQIQAVIDAGIVPKLIHMMQTAEFDIQKEAAYAIANMTSGGTPEQIFYIVQQGVLPPLCRLLVVADSNIAASALKSIDNIAKADAVLSEHDALISSSINDLTRKAANPLVQEDAINILEMLLSNSKRRQCIDATTAGDEKSHVDDSASAVLCGPLVSMNISQPSECVVCMINPCDATLVHGDTCVGHTCCCMSCAQALTSRRLRCPICRKAFTLVIRSIMS